jgi:hypothetical protein
MATLLHHLPLHPRSTLVGRSRTETAAGWWHELIWVPVAGVLGFAITAVTTWGLELSRSWMVAIYAPAAFALAAAYIVVNKIDLRATLLRHWRLGLGIGAVLGGLLVLTVQRQDASPRPEGWQLAWDVAWLGVVYGAADAILMNILPVMATWRVFSRRGWTESMRGKIGVGALAVVASIIVTVAVHAGYTEYQSAEMRQPMIGNTINTLAFVLSNNPFSSLISHVTMHIAAVFHGAETTVQLPPHY